MIFALSTDDRTLQVFESEAEAISYAEGIDVEDGVWAFFDDTGHALEPVFTKPNQRGSFVVSSGVYELHLAAPNTPALQAKLSEVSAIENSGQFNTVSEVEAWLASNPSFKRDA
ncbi:MAG TPA: hypothetical protein VK974_00335 [Methylophilaceae bacterium]|nr:hypothetical protein [Methylophilaceae bacterium]